MRVLGEANSRVHRLGAKWLQAHLSGWFLPYFLLGVRICMGYDCASSRPVRLTGSISRQSRGYLR